METMISMENIHFQYGGVPVLLDVGFVLRRGDFGAIIGSNGAGKSTLLKLLLGELHPMGGCIRLLGQENFRDWPRIGYVPQNSVQMAAGFPATAEEVVRANLYSQIGRFRPAGKQHREKALRALEKVGMRDYARQLVGTLSGGQLQRVMIARVLAGEPELMLLDEPTAGVDAHSAQALYELLAKLNRDTGLSIAIVTHDVAHIAPFVNRVFCLEQGTLVELNQEQVAHELAHRHTHPG